MGNSVSAHIYETKVFRPYPVILYRLRLDPSIHWWKKIGVPRNCTCTKFGVLGSLGKDSTVPLMEKNWYLAYSGVR